ncbi:MAG: hypothetical protein AB7K68_06555 [Bacteriovoracia bacterium]
MSNEMTFRQKTVRVVASAAICGLSISFLVGEAVDQQAKLLQQWTIDPAIFPVEYLPARPLAKTWQQLDSPVLKTQFMALNSRVPEAQIDPRTIRKEFEAFDVYKVTRAAPIPVVPKFAVVAEEKKAAAATMPQASAVPAEKELNVGEVGGILLSIHQATAKLSSAGVQSPSAAVKTIATAPKISSSPTYLPPEKQSAPLLAASTDIVVEADRQPGATWPLRGKILNSGILKEPGHFEIGLYSKIDSEGIPLGFPMVQQILPAGRLEFQLQVPAKIPTGFLFGAFVPAKGKKRIWIGPSINPWMKSDRQFAELMIQEEDTITTAAAAPVQPSLSATSAEDKWSIRGNVGTLFTKAGTRINQADVVVKVRGRREATRTDTGGNFILDLPRGNGTVYLELLKPGYHPAIVAVAAGDTKTVSVLLASREAVDRLASMMGSRQLSAKGVFIGKAVTAEGKGLRGFTAQMSLRAEGPFYFTEGGFPTSEKKQTTGDGRFIFFNVEPGTGYMESALNGEAVVPFQISSVEGGELTQKTLLPVSGGIKGRLFNPVSGAPTLQPVAGAKIRLEGSADWSTTDSFGAFSIGPTKWIKGEKAALEFSAEKFNNHRYAIDFENHKETLNLYAFPANYIRRLARSMDVDLDPYTGIVFGKASGPAIRMDALADHSTVNGAKDFYFDGRGRLRGSHTMTDPKYGTFVIFNVPKGRSLLQGSDGNGKLRYSDSVVASPSSVTVVMD